MHRTDKSSAGNLADTPSAILRHAAIYLWRYGWTTDAFYRHDDDGTVTMPAACMAGAIRIVVFGHPVEFLYDEDGRLLDDPAHTHLVNQVMAAQQVLADALDPQRAEEVGSLDAVGNWNDADGRTIAEVLIALYVAADDWDSTHPMVHNTPRTPPQVQP
jgi:hypothetical protein